MALSVVASINFDSYGPSTDHLTFAAAHVLVHAFMHSRVDYCNAILFGVGDWFVRKLPSVLHAAASLVTGVWVCLHVGSATENIIVAATHKCTDLLIFRS